MEKVIDVEMQKVKKVEIGSHRNMKHVAHSGRFQATYNNGVLIITFQNSTNVACERWSK